MIREALVEDREQVAAFMSHLWPDCNLEEAVETFDRAMPEVTESLFVAEFSKELIGFALVAIRKEYVEGADHGPVGYLEGIYVKPGNRGTGIGKLLLDACENWSREQGLSQMGSDAEIINENSIQFHHRSGFQEVNRIVNFIKNIN